MLEVFRRACTRVFKLDAATIDQLIKSSARSTHQRRPSIRRRALKNPAYALHDDFDPLAYLHEHDDVSALQRRAEPLQCKGELHTEEHLLALNRPIYIATDAHSPRTNADLTIFFNTFPCAFVLGDFVEVPELMALEAVRSLQEGVKMAPCVCFALLLREGGPDAVHSFLYPFLEAMMAAKSRIATIGCVSLPPRERSVEADSYIAHPLRLSPVSRQERYTEFTPPNPIRRPSTLYLQKTSKEQRTRRYHRFSSICTCTFYALRCTSSVIVETIWPDCV